MDLNKKNMKNIMLLIVFAVLFYVGVQRIESVAAGFSFVVSIVFPFLLGAAMAFILNVPMSFMEKRLFSKTKGKAKKLKRPICLVLAILFVVAILWIVLLVVIPEVASTVASLSVNIEAALIKLQRWAMDIFEDNKQIEVWIASFKFHHDCGKDCYQFCYELLCCFCVCMLYPPSKRETCCTNPKDFICLFL